MFAGWPCRITNKAIGCCRLPEQAKKLLTLVSTHLTEKKVITLHKGSDGHDTVLCHPAVLCRSEGHLSALYVHFCICSYFCAQQLEAAAAAAASADKLAGRYAASLQPGISAGQAPKAEMMTILSASLAGSLPCDWHPAKLAESMVFTSALGACPFEGPVAVGLPVHLLLISSGSSSLQQRCECKGSSSLMFILTVTTGTIASASAAFERLRRRVGP